MIVVGILLLVGGIVALLFMCKKANEYTRAQANVCWKVLFLRLYLGKKLFLNFTVPARLETFRLFP